MGVTTVVMMGLATAVSAGATAYSAHQKKEAADDQADELDRRLKMEVKQMDEDAKSLKSRQRAAYAAAGVELEEGTPLAVIEHTQNAARQDREEVLRRGKYTSETIRDEGSDIWTTGMWNTAGTLLGGSAKTAGTGKQLGVW